MEKPRVRFAPSPTGALHIGGVRTALYNYLLAKRFNGTFILRIEDTDQTRYVPGAEKYIIDSLEWLGLSIDEGPGQGGEYGPYRQSERKALYGKYAQQLIDNGHAYYAFDTPDELDKRREEEKEKGKHSFKYDAGMRMSMRNSLSLPAAEVEQLLSSEAPYAIRLKIPTDEVVLINDIVRGEVRFQSNELDDKIILKGDGMPTYHLANIVDDHLMKISHVIRGEEWLPSTAHHILLYRALGWEETMPVFAHLPLILKPNGKGKLSKRDGDKLGIPVFPLSWEGATEEESFKGFREFGFLPQAALNFLAFLGWNPGTEQEMFSLTELCEAFSLEKIGKAGARFDIDKAKWFNQQYIIAQNNATLAEMVRPMIAAKGFSPNTAFLQTFCGMMKERVTLLPDFWTAGYYFFSNELEYDAKTVRKKWKPENKAFFAEIKQLLASLDPFEAANIKTTIVGHMEANELGFGDVLPIVRVAVSGTVKGPDIFEIMELLGREEIQVRLAKGFATFDEMKAPSA